MENKSHGQLINIYDLGVVLQIIMRGHFILLDISEAIIDGDNDTLAAVDLKCVVLDFDYLCMLDASFYINNEMVYST